MQRRWAAIYLVFFVVMAASAYSIIAVAAPPPISVDGELTVTENSTVDYRGTTYAVGPITAAGEGEGEGTALVGTLAYTDPAVPESETFAPGDEIVYRNVTYNVTVATSNGSAPTATLVETFDVDARLAADPAVFNETVTSDGETFVRYRANDTLRPLDAYLPTPDRVELAPGDTIAYSPEENVTVQANVSVSADGLTLGWTVPEDVEVDLEEGTNVTLADGETYVVTFPSDDRAILSQSFQAYNAEVDRREAFHERENGLWGVVIISGFAAVLIAGLAYMPVRG